MTISRNLLAGLANSVWSALLALVMVPFYLKYLGVEAYGLIGFFVTAQALFQILDMGVAATLNREVARCYANGCLSEAGGLLHSLAIVYWVVALAIALSMLFLADFIASYWLQSKSISIQTITHSIILIGVVVACRWPIGLYQGALIGAQRLAISSLINVCMVSVASAGVLIIFVFLTPTIQSFFIWQACVGFMHAVIIRSVAWDIIGRGGKLKFEFALIKRVWRFAAGIGAVTLMGVVFTQLDKLLLSKLIGLEQYSHYMLASVVAGALYLIAGPVYSVVYSTFSAMVATGPTSEVIGKLRFYTRGLAVFLLPSAMIIAVLSKELIQSWTGSESLGNSVGPIASLLVIGAALNGLMTIPHALQLALGMTRIPLIINGVLMVVIIPTIVFLSSIYGAIGGAAAWLLFNVLYVFLSAWLTYKMVLGALAKSWLKKDILLPVCLVFIIGICMKFFYCWLDISILAKLFVGGAQAIIMFWIGILLSPELYSLVKNSIVGRWKNARKN